MCARGRNLIALVAVATLVGCGGDRSTSSQSDASGIDIFVDTGGGLDVADLSTGTADCQTFGCPCNGNSECDSELCIEATEGRICSETCDSQCPSGFDCVTVPSGTDPLSMCLPRHVRLCRPCREDAECVSPLDGFEAHCLPAADPAEGSFCATSCATRSCPSGYSCEEVSLPGGGNAEVCKRADDALCECLPGWAGQGYVTDCAETNVFGTCGGTRTCEASGLSACDAEDAAPETCDGTDENCDGIIDDGTTAICVIENDFGTCLGLLDCSTAVQCVGAEPSEEVCDGVDNDCDGEVDETACDDGSPCTEDSCDPGVGCIHEAPEASCTVDGVCYAAGQANPATSCEVCDPAIDPNGFTPLENVCNIDEVCVVSGASSPANPCLVCDPDRDRVSWSEAPVGAECDDGNACTTGDACDGAGGCVGVNSCDDGEPCTVDTCEAAGCESIPVASGTACDDGDPCTTGEACGAAGTCTGGVGCDDGIACTVDSCSPGVGCEHTIADGACFIDGVCHSVGDVNPANACERCGGGSSTSWSPVSAGSACDDGSPCTTGDACNGSGSCEGGAGCDDGISCTNDVCGANGCTSTVANNRCRIAGVCYNAGATNPNNSCQRCSPGTSQSSWSAKPAGTSCSDGSACTTGDSCNAAGNCSPGPGCSDGNPCTDDVCSASGCSYPISSNKCIIDGVCYDHNDTQPGNICFRCNTAVSKTSWSSNSGVACNDGDACTSGDVCHAGACNGTPQDDTSHEPNDVITQRYHLGNTFFANGVTKTVSSALFGPGDVDWFVYYVDVTGGGTFEPYATLTGIPAGSEYQVCMYFDCGTTVQTVNCPPGTAPAPSNITVPNEPVARGCCTTNPGSGTKTFSLGGGRFSCGGSGAYLGYVQVKHTGGAWSCSDYNLQVGDL